MKYMYIFRPSFTLKLCVKGGFVTEDITFIAKGTCPKTIFYKEHRYIYFLIFFLGGGVGGCCFTNMITCMILLNCSQRFICLRPSFILNSL